MLLFKLRHKHTYARTKTKQESKNIFFHILFFPLKLKWLEKKHVVLLFLLETAQTMEEEPRRQSANKVKQLMLKLLKIIYS